MRDPFFVVTSGRSGSLSLALTLSQHPYICALHEPFRPMIVLAWNKLCHPSKAHHREARLTWLQQCMPIPAGPQLCGIVDHKASHFIEDLGSLFPDSKFIWLTRDGRKVVKSIVDRGWYTDEEGATVGRGGNIWQNYRLNGDKVGACDAHQWGTMSQFGRCCWYWAWMQEQIREGLDALANPGRSYRMNLEEGQEHLENIQNWLGVDPVPLRMWHANVGPPTRKAEWTNDESKLFEQFCGKEMDRHYAGWRDEDARN